jgi:hypothetical protein
MTGRKCCDAAVFQPWANCGRRAPFARAVNRCSFVGELPAGPAVILPINASVDAVGGQAF